MTEDDEIADIYAPPKANLDTKIKYWVEGDFIVGTSPITLPDRCVKSNGERAGGRLSRSFNDTNTFTIGLRKKCHVTYSLNKDWRSRFGVRRLVAILGFFIGIAVIFLGIATNGTVALLGFVLIILSIHMSERACLPFRVAKHKKGHFYLRGFGKEFLESIEADRTFK